MTSKGISFQTDVCQLASETLLERHNEASSSHFAKCFNPENEFEYTIEVRVGSNIEGGERSVVRLILAFPEIPEHEAKQKVHQMGNIVIFKYEGVPHFHLEGFTGAACIKANNIFRELQVVLKGDQVEAVNGLVDQIYLNCKDEDQVEFQVQESQCPHLGAWGEDNFIGERSGGLGLDHKVFQFNVGSLASTPKRKEGAKGESTVNFIHTQQDQKTVVVPDLAGMMIEEITPMAQGKKDDPKGN